MRWLLLLLVPLVARAEEDPFQGANTFAQCAEVYLPAKKEMPTAYLRGFSVDYAACTRRVMNAELDTVLLPLKTTDPAKFKLGMDSQRRFNEAVKRYCGRWSAWYADCCSTCSYTEAPECEADFHAARVRLQALPLGDGAAKRSRVPAEFGEFAKQWCQFSGGDDACAGRVLATLEANQRDDGRALSCKARVK
jgi:hypothetical protein